MNINFAKINEIYGEDILYRLSEDIDDLIDNITYLKKIGFIDVYDIVERYPILFLTDNPSFISSVNSLLNRLGPNNIFQLENNMSLWEEIL